MPRAKKTSSAPESAIQAGKVKIPTSFVVAVIGALVTGVGGVAAGQYKDVAMENEIAELRKAQNDITELKTDVKWIKAYLSGGVPPSPDSPTEP
jgi:uncharacterized protein HemX